MVLLVLPAGCFQQEAPRPAARAPDAQSAAARQPPGHGLTAEPPDRSPAELAQEIRDAKDPALRRDAVYAMADVAGEPDVVAIGEALHDPNVSVRRAAVVALTGVEGEVATSYLVAALSDTEPQVRRDAVEALGEIGGPSVRQGLRQALMDNDAGVREAALQMLAENQAP